ncbi:glutamine amidotransferase [Paenibacillus sepulcri]|uniref:Glutamine amidotransferase n=1 Tax=Paenibacillus sepulcri TaxID=359917 RepID=A0ABS7C4T4_9BACL|nr:glutamine amidotransferase [Paenibacillus sepulcri]
MKSELSVLFVGESWFMHTIEVKGFDTFTFSGYDEAVEWIQKAIETSGHRFTHIPSHEVSKRFPATLAELQKYDVVLVSDVGANTFLLSPDTFLRSKRTVNKLALIAEFVKHGGGFGMIGGYLTFQGIEAKGNYKHTIIEEILPVELMEGDDRVELPEGVELTMSEAALPWLEGMPEKWPYILGYNRLKAKEDANVLISNGKDPIITIGSYGEGRTLAYATDCSPHWSPLEFCEWEYYSLLWDRLITSLAQSDRVN